MEEFLKILHEFLFGPDIPGLQKAFGPLAAVGLSAGISLVGGLFGGGAAKKAARAAAARTARLEGELRRAEESRQAVINPYEGVKDLSSMVTNPYKDIGVATQAAKIQSEEADIALANTLDTIRSTGASAGGATALAQAALKSKQNVAANIEQQEAANEKLKAEGEFKKDQMQMAEKQRIQQAEAAGKQFVFQAQEDREMQKLNRISAQLSGAQQQQMAAQQQSAAAWSGALSGIGGAIGAGIQGGAFS